MPSFEVVESVEAAVDGGSGDAELGGDLGNGQLPGFHGRRGDLRQAYQQGMEDQLGALGLILNCITLWNTVYLDAALTQLRARGYPVLDADVARLSPYRRRHLNVHGHYTFQLPVPAARCATRTSTTTTKTVEQVDRLFASNLPRRRAGTATVAVTSSD
ncbi:MAG: Tn3 family transposase [Pseudonocardia sp.]